jgi:general secretion pathway protein B
MSYVLDALRKADAERERGAVPTLLSQPEASIDIDPPRRWRPSPMLLGAFAALVLVAAGGLGWTLMAPAPSAPVALPMQADAPVTVPTQAQAPAAAPTQAEAPLPNPARAVAEAPPPRPLPEPKAAAAPPPSPPVAARVERPPPSALPAGTAPTPSANRAVVMAEARRERPRAAPSVAPAAAALPSPAGAAAAATAAPAPVAADTAATSSAGAAAAPSRPVALTQLPPSVRAELPSLAVGGSMYSDEPAARLVILNGQPYRERDVVAPGLTLELIQPRAAILEYRGYRIKLKL